MIYLFGPYDEPMIAALASRLGERSISCITVPQDRIGAEVNMNVASGQRGTHSICIGSDEYVLGNRDVIVNRSACSKDSGKDALVGSFLNTVSATVFNRPWLNMYLSSKPFQQIGTYCVGSVPHTVITNDIGFVKSLKAVKIFKSMSYQRSYATILDKIDESMDLTSCPVMFQEYIDHERNSKHHVIGGRTFEAVYITLLDDYRRDGKFKKHDLREVMSDEKCIKRSVVSGNLGTSYYDFDMRGDFFLELNPSPAVCEFDDADNRMLDCFIDHMLDIQKGQYGNDDRTR